MRVTERVELLSALCEVDFDCSALRVVDVLLWLWLCVRFGVERDAEGREAGREELREDDELLEEEELDRRTGVDIVIQDTMLQTLTGVARMLPTLYRCYQSVAVLH